MSADTQPNLIDGAITALWKLWPGIAGALIALRWQPAESTKLDRAVAAIGGFLSSVWIAPLIIDVASVSSHRIEAGIVFLVGLFSMVIVGELMLAVRSIAIGDIAAEWVRGILKLPRKGG